MCQSTVYARRGSGHCPYAATVASSMPTTVIWFFTLAGANVMNVS